MPEPESRTLHLISDSTGETLNAILRAALARFEGPPPNVTYSIFVRSDPDLDRAIAKVKATPGLIIYTLVDPALSARLLRTAEEMGTPITPAFDPVVAALATFLDKSAAVRPGMQHKVNTEYFDRISALDFAISHDDGALGDRLQQAHVILTGVSRSSKTPTCIYLAYRGIKAANVPLVPKTDPPAAFFDALDRNVPVIGLTASPSRLAQIRQNRLETIGTTKTPDYAEIDQIRGEVANARLFFEKHDIPVIDVTRRSIEETAAEILAILRSKGVEGA